MFKSLAFIVVQRQTAASKPRSPPSTEQQVSLASLPIPMCIRPPNTSTHAFNFNESIGHVGCVSVEGGGGGQVVSLGGGVMTGGKGTTGGLTTGGVGA